MNKSQKYGALAAIVCAASFIIGLSLILILVPDFNQGADQRLDIIKEHALLMQVWYFLVYIVFAISVLILTKSILVKEKREHSALEQVTTIVSYLWASYIVVSGLIAIVSIQFISSSTDAFTLNSTDLWQDIYKIQMGLGEGVEWVAAIWVLLVNACLHQGNRFNRSLIIFGVITSIFGLATLIPSLTEVGAIFGLLQTLWFLWVCLLLFKGFRETRDNGDIIGA
ncbi:hypothetical protein [Glaciecola sp. 1036]|uniref:hypothetical protein n=1 Tax=Alteromonadaceae TaxID=72275 RepID=UPI003D07F7C3